MLERNSTTSGLSCHGYVNVNESRRRLTPINESICTAEVRTVYDRRGAVVCCERCLHDTRDE